MVVCPSCRAEQMNGTLFCSECGADLQTPAAPTYDLPDGRADVLAAPAPASKAAGKASANGASSKSSPPPRAVAAPSEPATASRSSIRTKTNFRMMVLNSGRVLECPEQENVIIGRSDALTGDQPDIDLTPDNALELGVSRRHACLTFRETQAFLTDLGSTNRTFLNRQAMMRGQPYELQDGDEVRLGNVIMKVISDGNSAPPRR